MGSWWGRCFPSAGRAIVAGLAVMAGLVVLAGPARVGLGAGAKEKGMKVHDLYSLITTDKVFECRDFYVRHFGFEVAFETTIFVQLAAPAERGGAFTLAFMPPDHPFGTPGPEKFDGNGVYLTIQVADAAAVRDRLRAAGAPIDYDLKDEAWGQRRFMTRDPSGARIDVVQTIEPAKGFYDKYQVKDDGKK